MRIAIISDAWYPQVNGVVTSIEETRKVLEQLGHTVVVWGPDRYKFKVPLYLIYPEIRWTLFPKWKLWKFLDEFRPDSIHVSTEGPLGRSAIAYCENRKYAATSSLHTRFAEYVHMRFHIPLSFTWGVLRRFHSRFARTMVARQMLKDELMERGFRNLFIWSKGVDAEKFCPDDPASIPMEGTTPLLCYMGRVAPEKDIDEFAELTIPSRKYIVGDGPSRAELQKRFPEILFTGYKKGRELGQYVAAADVFVFPSKSETFGLVVPEANACGVPVAAYPCMGDLIVNGVNGWVHEDLSVAVMQCLRMYKEQGVAHVKEASRRVAQKYNWNDATIQFLDNLVTVSGEQFVWGYPSEHVSEIRS